MKILLVFVKIQKISASENYILYVSLILKIYRNKNSQIVGVKKMVVKRGDMFYADLSPVVGSEQGGVRPVLIIQNDIGNKHSPTVIAAAITSQTGKTKLPTHIEIDPVQSGLKAESVVLTEQIRTIDKSRLKEKIGHIDDEKVMSQINNALGVSFGINED